MVRQPHEKNILGPDQQFFISDIKRIKVLHCFMYWYKEKFDLMTRLMLQVSFPLELFYFYIQHAHF